VGQNVARRDIATARARARTGLLLGMGYMFLMGIVFFVFREPLIRLFLKPGEVPETAKQIVELGSSILIFAAVFQIFDAMGIVGSSALKGAGDTRFPALTTIVLGLAVFLPAAGSSPGRSTGRCSARGPGPPSTSSRSAS
jgi:MATE family multidrug resistance protein